MAEFFQHLLVQSQQQALHEAARAASSSSAGSKPGPGAPSGDPSIKSVLVMPVGTETDMDLSVPVAAVRQPADASVIAARARDQAAFDAAASTLAAGALDDAARETEFEAALRFASPASDDGSGDSEIGETDADGLSPLSAPTGLRYMPGDHTESVLVDSQREGSRFIVRRIAPLLMPLSKWYALLASEPRALSRAVGLLFTNGMEGHKQIPLVRKLAGEGTIGIVADRFLGACGLNRADRLLLGRLTQRTEVNNLACVIETAAVVARTDHRLHEGPDSGRAMRAILRAAFAHPEDPGSCSGVGPPPDDSEVVWPDLAFEFDTASPRAWDDLLAAWEQHAPKSACWDLASEASWLSDSDRSPILSLLVASAYLLAQPGLQWPRILAENANGNSRQRSSLHFPTPAADPGDLTGYGPDRPSDLAVPESPEGAPPGGLNAPIPIAHVIDGISGRPHDFRRLQLQCPGFVYALNADGTLGASTRVQILFDTGAMGEVGEKRHMPPGTRYTGVKVLRAFLHHATITAEIAHVVLRFGDVYVSRAVYVVPDGSLGPNADLLVGIGTIMMVEGRIDTTSSGWCLHARDAQFRPHVIPFCCPDKRRGLSLSGSFALSS
eukprot:tig00020675_g12631.t1